MSRDNFTLLDHNGQRFQTDEDSSDGSALPHVLTFGSIIAGGSHTYYHGKWDEALRHNRQNALVMRRDPFIMRLMDERKEGTVSLKWHLESDNDKDPRQKQVVDGLTKIIRATPRLKEMLRHLMEALWYGRYGSNVVWRWKLLDLPEAPPPVAVSLPGMPPAAGKPAPLVRQTRCLTVAKHRPVNGDKIGHHHDGTPYVLVYGGSEDKLPRAHRIYTTEAPAVLLRGTWRERVIIHKHAPDDADYFDSEAAGGIHGVGIRSRIYWADWMRREYISWVAESLERLGLGLVIIYYDASNPKAKDEAIATSKRYNRRSALVMPRSPDQNWTGGSVQVVEAPVAGASVVLQLQQHLEDQIERYIVGQTLSAGTEGSGLGGTGVAALHADTKNKIIAGDAEELQETLTGSDEEPGLVSVIKRYTYPWADFPVRWVFDLEDDAVGEKINAIISLAGIGVKFKEQEARGLTGMSDPEEGDETIGGAPMLPPGMGGPPGTGPDGGPDDDGGGPDGDGDPTGDPLQGLAEMPGEQGLHYGAEHAEHYGAEDQPRDTHGRWTGVIRSRSRKEHHYVNGRRVTPQEHAAHVAAGGESSFHKTTVPLQPHEADEYAKAFGGAAVDTSVFGTPPPAHAAPAAPAKAAPAKPADDRPLHHHVHHAFHDILAKLPESHFGLIPIADLHDEAKRRAGRDVPLHETHAAIKDLRRSGVLRLVATGTGRGEADSPSTTAARTWDHGIPGDNEHFVSVERGNGYQPPEQFARPDRAEHYAWEKQPRNDSGEWTAPKPRRAGTLAERIAAAAAETDTSPSEAQKQSGNYRKGKVQIHGLPITIETPKGAARSGKAKDGKAWSVTMGSHYGYIRTTESEADGDHVDCFVGPHPHSEIVFVVDQMTPGGGRFDEHKCMLGFTSEREARAGYLACYSPGWQGLGKITPMTVPQFKRWLKRGDTSRPAAGQVKYGRRGPERYAGDEGPRGWGSAELAKTYHEPKADLTDAHLKAAAGRPALPMPDHSGVDPAHLHDAWGAVSRLYPEMAAKIKKIGHYDPKTIPPGEDVRAFVNPHTGHLGIKPGQPLAADSLWHELVHVEQHHRGDMRKPRTEMDPDEFNDLEQEARQRQEHARGLLERFRKHLSAGRVKHRRGEGAERYGSEPDPELSRDNDLREAVVNWDRHVYFHSETGTVWVATHDSDSGKLVDGLVAYLKKIPTVHKVKVEPESSPPKGEGWVEITEVGQVKYRRPERPEHYATEPQGGGRPAPLPTRKPAAPTLHALTARPAPAAAPAAPPPPSALAKHAADFTPARTLDEAHDYARTRLRIPEVDLGTDLDEANHHLQGLHALQRAHYPMPVKLTVGASGGVESGSYSDRSIRLAPDLKKAAALKAEARARLAARGETLPEVSSTQDPHHTLAHELGHYLHAAGGGFKDPATKEQKFRTAKVDDVSATAKRDHREFVAEVFAGKALGRKFGPETMRLYKELGGYWHPTWAEDRPQQHMGREEKAEHYAAEGADETTTPKVYHGTTSQFSTFDKAKLGQSSKHPTARLGFYFSESPTIARHFSGETVSLRKARNINKIAHEKHGKEYHYLPFGPDRKAVEAEYNAQPDIEEWKRHAEGGRVIEARLAIKNPYRMPFQEWHSEFIKPYLGSLGGDQSAIHHKVDEFKAGLVAKGHDGILLEKAPGQSNPHNEYSAHSWIAFEPHQIRQGDSSEHYGKDCAEHYAARPTQLAPAAPPSITAHTSRHPETGTLTARLRLGDKTIGRATVTRDGLQTRHLPLKAKDKFGVDVSGPVHRFDSIEVAGSHRGKGLGQQLYLHALAANPDSWHYNGQASPEAHRSLLKLHEKGLIELHKWRPTEAHEDAGAHIKKITPKGLEYLRSLGGDGGSGGAAPERYAADGAGAAPPQQQQPAAPKAPRPLRQVLARPQPKGVQAPAAPVAPAAVPASPAPAPLTPEHHAEDWRKNHVRSAAFKAFFGDWEADHHGSSKVRHPETGEPHPTHEIPGTGSHVKGADGKPIPVYHGTARGGFEAFDKSKISADNLYGPGFYFTEDKDVADSYRKKGTPQYELAGHPAEVGAKLRPKLKAQVADLQEELERGKELDRMAGGGDLYSSRPAERLEHVRRHLELPDEELAAKVFAGDHLGFAPHVHPDDFRKQVGDDTISAYLNVRKPFDPDKDRIPLEVLKKHMPVTADRWQRLFSQEGQSDVSYDELAHAVPKGGDWKSGKEAANWLLQELGYDGITHIGGSRAGDGTKPHRVWIAFEPHQIKHTANRGTFDPNDPRMHYGEDGAEHYAGLFNEDDHPRADDGKFAPKPVTAAHVREAKRSAAAGKLKVKTADEPFASDATGRQIRRHVTLASGYRLHPDELHRLKVKDGEVHVGTDEGLTVNDPASGRDQVRTFGRALSRVSRYKGRPGDLVTIQSAHGYVVSLHRSEWAAIKKQIEDGETTFSEWYDEHGHGAKPKGPAEPEKPAASIASEKETAQLFAPRAEQARLFGRSERAEHYGPEMPAAPITPAAQPAAPSQPAAPQLPKPAGPRGLKDILKRPPPKGTQPVAPPPPAATPPAQRLTDRNLAHARVMAAEDPKHIEHVHANVPGLKRVEGIPGGVYVRPGSELERTLAAHPVQLRPLSDAEAQRAKLLPPEMAEHLRDEETGSLKAHHAKKLAQVWKQLPPAEEFEAAALGGEAKRGWYANAAESIKSVFAHAPHDHERFVGLLAATSPRQPVEQNMKMTAKIWAAWEKAGRPTELVRKAVPVLDEHTGKPKVGPDGRPQTKEITTLDFLSQVPGAEMGSRLGNVIAALTGEHGNLKLSGDKVESFRRNLMGDLDASTNDVWMAIFSGIDPEKDPFGSRLTYKAFTAKIRQTASKLGWKPAEAQETIWSFVRSLAGLAKAGLSPEESLNRLTHEHVKTTDDFATILLEDPHVRAELKRAGLGRALSRLAKLNRGGKAGSGAEAPTGRVEGLDPGVSQRVAQRAGKFAGSFRDPPDLSRLAPPQQQQMHRGEWAEHYATKEAGQWITIGATEGADGKRHGGSPVYVENGRITKGHPSLTGKKIEALEEKSREHHEEKPAEPKKPTAPQESMEDRNTRLLAERREAEAKRREDDESFAARMKAPIPAEAYKPKDGDESAKLPPDILGQVRRAAARLQQFEKDADHARHTDRMFAGEGRYESEFFKSKQAPQQARELIEKFKGLATENDIDGDKVLGELGGVPDTQKSKAAVSWETPEELRPRTKPAAPAEKQPEPPTPEPKKVAPKFKLTGDDESTHRQQLHREKGHARAVWAKKAKAEGVDPAGLHQLAADLQAHDAEHKKDVARLLGEVRKRHPHLKSLTARGGSGIDADSVKGLDDVADLYANRSEYAHLFGSHDPEERLFDLLVAGNPQPMGEEEAYEQAFDHLMQARYEERAKKGSLFDDPKSADFAGMAGRAAKSRRRHAPDEGSGGLDSIPF